MARQALSPNEQIRLPGICCVGYQNKSIIYGFGDIRNGKIVYIGQSTQPGVRFQSYRNLKNCHNVHLKRWLKKYQQYVFTSILYVGNDLDKMERFWISKLGRDSLLNLTDGGSGWKRENLGWNSPTGVRCPSDLFIWPILNRTRNQKCNKESIKEHLNDLVAARKQMTQIERALFEITVARDVLNGKIPHFDLIEKMNIWLDEMTPRLSLFLGGSI